MVPLLLHQTEVLGNNQRSIVLFAVSRCCDHYINPNYKSSVPPCTEAHPHLPPSRLSLLLPPPLSRRLTLRASKMEFTLILRNTSSGPGVNCHCWGHQITEEQTAALLSRRSNLYKLHLGFAYLCLRVAWHIRKWNTGAECEPPSFRQRLWL